MIAGSFVVRLTLEGPVLTQSTAQGRWGVDATMAKSGDHYYLPGTLIKGLVGEAWRELECGDTGFEQAAKDWLGVKSEKKGKNNEPGRGMLFFEDLVDLTTNPDKVTDTLYRIEIDAERGSVKRGHYKVAEAPYKRGATAVFEGRLWAIGKDRAALEDVHKRVQTALRWMRAAGSERTIGFGQLREGTCEPLEIREEWRKEPDPSSEEAFEIALKFDRPVCFARRKVANNLFESEEWITGGALKGCVATVLQLEKGWWPELQANLHAVRFTHALPGPENSGRADYPAESLALPDRNKELADLRDVLRWDGPRLVDGKKLAFQVDWKKEPKGFRDHYRWKNPSREMRVRTAIEGAERKALEENLFAYEMLSPMGVVWRAQVYLDGVDARVRGKVAGQLREALRHGLFAMGKTKAHARADPPGPLAKATEAGNNGVVAIKLRSAALLCVPGRCLAPNEETGSTDAGKMREEYEAVWRDLGDGALALKNYFHRQSLAGGGYVFNRFQQGKQYTPYLMTDAGSVFLLEVKDAEKAKALVAGWLKRGLPLTPAVKRFYGLDGVAESELWQFCPYLPENGFGEIAIDQKEAGHV